MYHYFELSSIATSVWSLLDEAHLYLRVNEVKIGYYLVTESCDGVTYIMKNLMIIIIANMNEGI